MSTPPPAAGAAPAPGADATPAGTPPPAAPAAGAETKPAAGTETKPAPKPSVFAKDLPPEVDLSLPEGFDAKAGETLKALAGKLGLDKDKGGELVKAYAEAQKAAQAEAEARFEKQTAEWKAAARADPSIVELGGFEKVARNADKVVTRFDPDGKLSEILGSSGLAMHPAVLGFFGRVASALKEDSIASGGARPNGQPDPMQAARALYPNSQDLFRKE